MLLRDFKQAVAERMDGWTLAPFWNGSRMPIRSHRPHDKLDRADRCRSLAERLVQARRNRRPAALTGFLFGKGHKTGVLMSTIDSLVHDFLAQKRIAVVGVSDKRETGCNLGYRKFKEAGYTVYAVNPHLTTFEGAPCYPDLQSISEKPDAVFILANPNVTEQIVQQCVDLGSKRVWMHCMMG